MSDTAKMPEAAKSPAEIEDVLSSIRRLVSEYHPAPTRVAAPVDDKLVLTPALRVMDPDDPWTPVPRPFDDSATDTPTDTTDRPFGPEDRLSDWGAVEAEATADAGAKTSDDSSDDDNTDIDATDAAEAVADLLQETDPAAMAEPAEDPQDVVDLAMLDGVLPVAPVADEFEPETGDADWPDVHANGALRHLVAARGGDVSADAGAADAAVDPAEDNAPIAAETPDDTEALAAEMSEFTPIFSRRTLPESDPDMPDDPPEILTEEELEAAHPTDDPELDTDTALDGALHHSAADADTIEDLGEAASPFSFPDMDEGILDEDTLREIIVDVVREELQGVLGQRITRNVRKMVRREIRLALAAEELE